MSDNKKYERRCMYCGKKLPSYINTNTNFCSYGCDSRDLQKVLDVCSPKGRRKEKTK
ncbi:MAG: hypothetical protein IJF03_10015 [Lachnospiraceae bacterium]|nr:hypothetical protein [Lachnospiraceae bacterium]